MALIDIGGEDSWLKDYEYLGSLISEINQAIVRRRQLQFNNLEHAHLSSQLRKQIPQAEQQLFTLRNVLEDPASTLSRLLVPGERERRFRLCENLRSTLKKASEEYYRGPAHHGSFSKVADLGTLNWGEDETEVTRSLPSAELRAQQQQVIECPEFSVVQGHIHIQELILASQEAVMDPQDAVLESISAVVGNQKHIAKAIQTEVEDQDELLIDIRDKTTNNQTNLEQQTSNVVEATRKASTCGYWIVILILLIAIIIVAVW